MTEWLEQARCRNFDPDMLFGNVAGQANVRRFICGPCPVKTECLQEAMRLPYIPHGVWGGIAEARVQSLWMASGGMRGRNSA